MCSVKKNLHKDRTDFTETNFLILAVSINVCGGNFTINLFLHMASHFCMKHFIHLESYVYLDPKRGVKLEKIDL